MTVPYNPKRTLILGAAWSVSTRWAIKGIGFLNTIIMARLVLPADYGIVAMAMLVVGLIQAIMDFSATTALMRKNEVSRDEVDSAWTLRWIQHIGVGLILAIAAPVAALYFKEPRVQSVLWVLAACVSISGAGNIGFVLAQKEFNFSLEFKHQVICKILGVMATVAGGYWLRDYRALVFGVATGYISGLILSYVMHPYRPIWNTSKFGEIWAVTKWLMLAGVGGFILGKGDELMAARVGTTADYGLYNVGADFGQLPTGQVGPAMLRAFLPVLVSLRGSVEDVNAAVIKTAAAVTTMTFPLGFGLAALATPATHLLLGSGWSGADQYVAVFSIFGALQIVQSPFSTLLTLRGHTKMQSKAVWLEFIVFLTSAAILVPMFFLMGFVWARMLGSASNLTVTLLSVRRNCRLSLKVTAIALVRPLGGAVLMYWLVKAAVSHVDGDVLKLSLGIACGVIVFSMWSFMSWLVVRRPDGLESTILGYIR